MWYFVVIQPKASPPSFTITRCAWGGSGGEGAMVEVTLSNEHCTIFIAIDLALLLFDFLPFPPTSVELIAFGTVWFCGWLARWFP